MKKILIATTNPGKIMTAKKILEVLGYEGVSFSDLGISLNEPEETKATAEEIAVEKALGYALAWHDGDEVRVVSGLATTGTEKTKIVSEASPARVPGFCFAPVMKVLVNGEWKYDAELTDKESWEAYWNLQAETILGLIEKCPVL